MISPEGASTTAISHPGWLGARDHDAQRATAHALVIAWSLAEPHRVGEVALLSDAGRAHILGRGGPLPDDEGARVRFARHRSGGPEPEPLAAPAISRRQVVLSPSPDGVRFARVGRCAVLHNGVPCDDGVLRAGDCLTLVHQLVLYVTRRRTRAPGGDGAAFPFGAPDAHGILGESEASWRLREELATVARSSAHVLVLGESGAGKELAARAIHRLSPRASRAFVARSAAAIPPGLIDAELFGNRRDYPNSGMPEREGVVGAAHGGTLFLDEIGELAPELQTHLLRLLDGGGEYHRLGETHARKSDLRMVAATNRSPDQLKHDFAARFAVHLVVPGLDARREDVPLLARHLLDEIAAGDPALRARFFEAGAGGPFARVDPALIEALLRRRWATHVRELRALLWASIRASRGHYLTIPPELATEAVAACAPDAASDDEPSARVVLDALTRHKGNQSKAYVELGLPSRFALYRLMRKYGIDPRESAGRRR